MRAIRLSAGGATVLLLLAVTATAKAVGAETASAPRLQLAQTRAPYLHDDRGNQLGLGAPPLQANPTASGAAPTRHHRHRRHHRHHAAAQ